MISFRATSEIEIAPVADRWYRLIAEVWIFVTRDRDVLVYRFLPGFMFDGRSGGPFADLIAPNLGTQEELACWMIHDANGYGTLLTFDETNQLLHAMLRSVGYSRFRSWLIRSAVSLSRGWFGYPRAGEREMVNVEPRRLFEVRVRAR